MFYYLYEIKNLINDKIYVGVHKTKNLNDGYMGSGSEILSEIKSIGESNFSKTILEFFDTSEQMYAREKEVVNNDFLSRPDVYNRRRGGLGGFDYINQSNISKFKGRKHSDQTKVNISEKLKGNTNSTGAVRSDEYRERMSNAKKGIPGRIISEEEKERIRTTLKSKKDEIFYKRVCPHCGKEGKGPAMTRYHFDKCKRV